MNWIAGALFIGPIFVAHVGPLIVSLLRAKRKGRLSVEKTHFYEGMQPEKLKGFLRKQLLEEKFKLEEGTDRLTVEAKRACHRPNKVPMAAYPFHKLPLTVRVELLPHPGGTQARAIVGTTTYVIEDTGESEYLMAVAEYVMGANQREVGPDWHDTARNAPWLAVMALACPWIAFVPALRDEVAREFLHGAFLVSILTIVMASLGLIQIALHPTWYRGYAYAGASAAAGFVALGGAIAAYYFYHG